MEAIIQATYSDLFGVIATPDQVAYWSGQITRRIVTTNNLKYAIAREVVSQPVDIVVETNTPTVKLSDLGQGITREQILSGKVLRNRTVEEVTQAPPVTGFKKDLIRALVYNNSWNQELTSAKYALFSQKLEISKYFSTNWINKTPFIFITPDGGMYSNGYYNQVPLDSTEGYIFYGFSSGETTSSIAYVTCTFGVFKKILSRSMWGMEPAWANPPAKVSDVEVPEVLKNAQPVLFDFANTEIERLFDTNLQLFTDAEINAIRDGSYDINPSSQILVPKVDITVTTTKVITDTIVIPPGDINQLLLELQKDAHIEQKARAYLLSFYASKVKNEVTGLFFQHNWTAPVMERLEYQTTVSTARGGIEHRRALRRFPRSYIEFNYLLDKNKLQYFTNFMRRHHSHKIDTPLWQRSQKVLGVTETEVKLKYPLAVGEIILVSGSWRYPVMKSVAAVVKDGDEFLVSFDSTVGILQGQDITPVRKGRVRETAKVSYLTPTVGTVTTSIIVEDTVPEKEVQIPEIQSSSNGIQNAALYLLEPNYTAQPVVTLERRTADVDYGNKFKLFDLEAFAERKTQRQYTVQTNKKGFNIIDAFHHAKGKLNPFYIPTYFDDIRIMPNQTVQAGAIKFKASATGLHLLGDVLVGKPIIVFFHAKPYKIFMVDSVVNVGDVDYINISQGTPITESFTSKDVKMISILEYCRFSSDTLEINWITRELANVTAQFEILNG